jgi:hypothetical protein
LNLHSFFRLVRRFKIEHLIWATMVSPVTTRTFTSIEQLHIFTPLGIRFWDVALDVAITHGLEVHAYPADRPNARRRASITASGIYAFHDLPGLQAIEYPRQPLPQPGSPLAPVRFMVEVQDALHRFLPVVFSVELPYWGIFPTSMPVDAQGTRVPGFYLFSAPTRSALPTQGVLRVQLEEITAGGQQQAASYALLEMELPNGRTIRGLADDQGRVAIILPYPAFPAATGGRSPLGSAGLEFQQSWSVRLRVRYNPALLQRPAGSSLPELRTIFAQTPALIWPSQPTPFGQPLDELMHELFFGQESIIRSGGSSTLLISAMASPL